jgi:uncharacterized protein YsxB (DUF464 family)
MGLVQQEGESMNIDIICAMIVLVITTTASVIIFLGFDHKFESGFKEGYAKARTEQRYERKLKMQNMVNKYESMGNNCIEKSYRADISEKQRDYLRWRANCYKDIISDLKKGIDDGIS